MHQVDNLQPFVDQSGSRCEAQPVAAYGFEDESAEVSALAIEGDLLFAFVRDYGDDSSWLSVLDISDPKHIEDLARLDLQTDQYIHSVSLHDGVLYATWSRPNEEVLTIDVSSPDSPAILDQLRLGRSGAATTFAANDDLIYTDGGDFHAIRSPSDMVGVTYPGLRPFTSPLIVDGQLWSAARDLAIDECAVEIYNIDGEVPVLNREIATTSCLNAGLDDNDLGVVGIGFDDDANPVIAQMSDDQDWEVSLEDTGMEQLDGIRGYRSGALVIGGNGYRHGVAAWDGADTVSTWFTGQAFVEDLDLSDDHVWVTLERESGAFRGLVALDFSECVPAPVLQVRR